MKICCFGSLNIDMVFSVNEFVKPKETIQSRNLARFAGGKGLNQAVALRKSGAAVIMAGSIGSDGDFLLAECDRHGLDRSLVREIATPTGLAVIQVNGHGENCIILYDGANKKNDLPYIDEVLESLGRGDYIVLQNEISNLAYILKRASEKGVIIFLNPSPIDEELLKLPLDLCDYLILNEVEGEILSGEKESGDIMQSLMKKYPGSRIVLTLGEKGVSYGFGQEIKKIPAKKVTAVDTTGAGDAFTGYFIGMLSRGADLDEAMEAAVKAAAISVTKRGASDSIPYMEEVLESTLV